MIDAHTHVYPEWVAQNPLRFVQDSAESHWGEMVLPRNGRPSIQGFASPEEMIRAMDASGVQTAILLGWYWEQAKTCRWHNEVMVEWMHYAPDRLLAFASIYPDETIDSQLQEIQDQGFFGIGELHIGVQNYSHENAYWHRLFTYCQSNGLPINFHVTESLLWKPLGQVPTPFEAFIEIARRYPDLVMILAHLGGGLPFFAQHRHLAQALKNVYYDTAALPLLYHPQILRPIADLVGADRLIFGSDYPLRLYPKQKNPQDMTTFVEQLRCDSELDAIELEAMFAGNIRRLLKTR